MIYFIQNTRNGLVKIGFARKPKVRLSELQIGSADRLIILGVIPGDMAREKAIQARFQKRGRWRRGEWFAVTAREVAEFIECEAAIAAGEQQHLLPFDRSAKPVESPLVFTIDVNAA